METNSVALNLITTNVKTEKPMLFLVWVNTNPGDPASPDWEMNSAHLCSGKPLQTALDEAAALRKAEWETKVLPVGFTPRNDGIFTNPVTEP